MEQENLKQEDIYYSLKETKKDNCKILLIPAVII